MGSKWVSKIMDNINNNHDDDIEISFEQIINIIKKNVLLIFVFLILGVLLSFLITKFAMKEKYTATIKLYVDAQSSNENVNLSEFNYYKALAKTYIQMLDTNNFYQKVQQESNIGYTADQIKSMVSYSILNDTEIFQINVVSEFPQYAKKIADTIITIAPNLISEFQRNASLRVLDDAVLPTTPTSPNLKINLVVGALLGVALALLIAFVKEAMDTTVKGEQDLIEKYNIPVLVCIPVFLDINDTAKIQTGGIANGETQK